MPGTILIMAGGTGGHIYPGLAVASALRERGWRIVWLGTRKGMEARIVPQEGIEMAWLGMSGLRGNGFARKVIMPGMLIMAMFQALRTILHYRPNVVLGLGGYPSFPGGVMAVLTRVPLMIHEQNAIAGLSNRMLACWATKVMTGFPGALGQAQDRPIPCGKVDTVWTGNPVRASLAVTLDDKAKRQGPLRLLVVGGSLGAQALNEQVPEALALMPVEQRPQVIHQSGARHVEALQEKYRAVDVTVDARAYIDGMADVYAWCDVAITRAGALTIAELAAAGVPAILVPYPHAVDDHQTRNAGFLVDSGAAWLMPQSGMSPQALADLLGSLNRETLSRMARRARAVAKPHAAAVVADICEEVAQ